MRKMHGLVATLLGLSLACGLYGCGGGSSEPATSPDTEAPVEEVAEEEVATEEAANTGIGDFVEMKLPSSAYHYELNEVSSFAAERGFLQIQRNAPISFDSNDNALLLGLDGKPLLDGQAIRGIEYFANGVYTYAADVEDVNNCGLVSLTDGMLLGPEAAKVAYKTEDPADARFLEVIYATEETDNKDECFIFATDAFFALSPDEDDVMYKGYAKVFDLKNKRFVEGVQIDNASLHALHDLGDAFVVEGTDEVYTMYDENGKELWSSDYYPSFSTSTLMFTGSGKSMIVDSTGKTTFEYDGYLSALSNSDDLYTYTEDEKEYAIDSKGNLVLKDGYEDVYACYHGMFVVTDDGVTKIVDSNGNVLADDLQEFTPQETLPGVITYKNTNDKYALCFSDGRVVEATDSSSSSLAFEDEDGNCLVLADGTFSLKVDYSDALDKGLISGRGDDNMSTYGLYDLFTGKELLDSSYTAIEDAGGYIFARKDGVCTVYEAKLVQD